MSVHSSAFDHIVRMLARVQGRKKTQEANIKVFTDQWIDWTFRSFRPSVRMQDNIKPVLKVIQSKAMYEPRLSRTLIVFLRVRGGVRTPKVAQIRVFTDQWIPGHFGHFVLGSHARQDQHLFKHDPDQ